MADVIGDMVSVSCSFQTMDPVVMANVKRVNISLEDLKKAQDHFNANNISTHTELILGLPEETKESEVKIPDLADLFSDALSELGTISGEAGKADEEKKKKKK